MCARAGAGTDTRSTTTARAELQRLYAQMDQAKQRAPALEQEFAELQRRIAELEGDEIAAVLPEEKVERP